MKSLTYAIIGYGNRGSVYAEKLKKNNRDVVAVCDTCAFQLENTKKLYANAEVFSDEDAFFEKKRADVLIIATMDRLHYRQTLKAIELQYDILLEKPISVNIRECEEIAQKSEKNNVKILVCHVLRYTYFYSEIKKVIEEGKIGKVINIQAAENVNLGHYISSFVRGRWHSAKDSTPIIVQKCCHDFDIIYYLMGSNCKKVSSFGNLSYFNTDNKPKNSEDFCYKCKVDNCLYNSIDLYTKFPCSINTYEFEHTADGVKKLLSDENNPYSRCIYKSGNDVCDHQVVNMEFENGSTASLTMTAFNQEGCRTILVHGTKGTVEGKLEDGVIKVRLYDKKFDFKDFDEVIDTKSGDYYSHSGGDDNIIKDVIDYFENKVTDLKVSEIKDAVMSHKMAFAAEASRIQGGKSVDLKN